MTVNLELGYHKTPYHFGTYHSAYTQGTDGAQFLSKHADQAGAQFFASIEGGKYLGVQFGGYSNVGHTDCAYHAGDKTT